ncbi:hypothetical protein GUJ93_ZPchr0388g2756 [Zizania palustris]|uniref:Thg1 C-terminal domain-containing protein n=1 Tax=Zizania palustris TaxID=103762 RepID=A0A8J5R3A3_ZIZPA|nr:hypothetical protein GUJ93_ZPchr0388g2756 [Zizania palustris]
MHPAESEASSSSGSLRHHLNRSRTEVTWYPSQGDGTTPSQLLQSSDQNVNGHPKRIAIGSVDSWDEFGRTSQNYWYDSSRNGEAVSISGSATRQLTYEPDDDHFASRELENPSGDADIYGRLQEALHEAHYSKKEAYKESIKRRHIEINMLYALQKIEKLQQERDSAVSEAEDLCQKNKQRISIPGEIATAGIVLHSWSWKGKSHGSVAKLNRTEAILEFCGGMMFPDIVFAYGVSDEYKYITFSQKCLLSSFVFREETEFYQRRESKILSLCVSYFTSVYVMKWKDFFPNKELIEPPYFDGRVTIRDYLAWRQVDCHINNQYNTCFWLLVKSGKTEKEAQQALKGTFSKDKNELLLQQFQINYDDEPAIFRKGSCVYRDKVEI